MLPRPPNPTLFPYTTLFRSHRDAQRPQCGARLPGTTERAHRESRQAGFDPGVPSPVRSEEHTSELQSHSDLVCRLLLEKKKKIKIKKKELTQSIAVIYTPNE